VCRWFLIEDELSALLPAIRYLVTDSHSHTPADRRSPVIRKFLPGFELPLLGSNQDSPDSERPA
jgi:hypothetical protein